MEYHLVLVIVMKIIAFLDNAHYFASVMRVKLGYLFRIFNSIHGEYLCRITAIGSSRSKSITYEVLQQLRQPPKSYFPCSLICAPIKKPRLKTLLEKVTEIGIEQILFVSTQNSNSEFPFHSNGEIEQSYQNILVQSAEQSERLTIPTIFNKELTLKQFLQYLQDGKHQEYLNFARVFVCLERSEENKKHLLLEVQNLIDEVRGNAVDSVIEMPSFAVFIGPEGGFSGEEIAVLKAFAIENPSKLQLVSLGGMVN